MAGMTKIRTARAVYDVTDVQLVKGTLVIVGKGANGRVRMLKRSDITNVRWYAALEDYFRRVRAARTA